MSGKCIFESGSTEEAGETSLTGGTRPRGRSGLSERASEMYRLRARKVYVERESHPSGASITSCYCSSVSLRATGPIPNASHGQGGPLVSLPVQCDLGHPLMVRPSTSVSLVCARSRHPERRERRRIGWKTAGPPIGQSRGESSGLGGAAAPSVGCSIGRPCMAMRAEGCNSS